MATGFEPFVPNIPGVEHAVLADDVLAGKVDVRESAVIVGGGMVGCELGIELAKRARRSQLLRPSPVSVPSLAELLFPFVCLWADASKLFFGVVCCSEIIGFGFTSCIVEKSRFRVFRADRSG